MCISTFIQLALLLWRMWSTETIVSQLKYLVKLVKSTISRFFAAKALDQPVSSPTVSNRLDPIVVEDQASADIVRGQLEDLSQKIHTTVQPVFVSQKIGRDLKLREAKPPIVNQQCPVSNLNVVSHAVICTNVLSAGCRTQKLFFINWQAFPRQTIFGSKGSYKNFSVLMKCTNEFDCLVYEMFLLTNWDLLSMYTDLTEFVLRFLISFSLVFFLVCFFILRLHLQHEKIKFISTSGRACNNLFIM